MLSFYLKSFSIIWRQTVQLQSPVTIWQSPSLVCLWKLFNMQAKSYKLFFLLTLVTPRSWIPRESTGWFFTRASPAGSLVRTGPAWWEGGNCAEVCIASRWPLFSGNSFYDGPKQQGKKCVYLGKRWRQVEKRQTNGQKREDWAETKSHCNWRRENEESVKTVSVSAVT